MASLAESSGDHQRHHPKILFNGNIPEDPPTLNDSANEGREGERRGRLKRRRLSSHSPPRAPSPSRGHDRGSGSRHRHHHRNHHRPSSSASPMPSPPSVKKNRRRSDAEPDHGLRGRARNRSESRSRSPILEADGREVKREHRKRSQPPSRHRIEEEGEDGGAVRRQRSFPNLYKGGSQQEKGEKMEGIKRGESLEGKEKGGLAPTVQEA